MARRNIYSAIIEASFTGDTRPVPSPQDLAVAAHKLPSLVCRPVGAYLMEGDLVALLEFEEDGEDIRVANEQHYRLVPPDSVSDEELARYRSRMAV